MARDLTQIAHRGGRQQPRGLRETTLLMAVGNVLGFTLIDWTNNIASAVGTAVIAVSFVVLWFYWQGRNWARWLVLLTSIEALANLTALRSGSIYLIAVIIAEAALAIFLLYWLNTRAVRAFFASSGTGSSEIPDGPPKR